MLHLIGALVTSRLRGYPDPARPSPPVTGVVVGWDAADEGGGCSLRDQALWTRGGAPRPPWLRVLSLQGPAGAAPGDSDQTADPDCRWYPLARAEQLLDGVHHHERWVGRLYHVYAVPQGGAAAVPLPPGEGCREAALGLMASAAGRLALGAYFEGYSQTLGRFLPTPYMRRRYPDDVTPEAEREVAELETRFALDIVDD